MWSFKNFRAVVGLSFLGLSVTACGFQPLYGTGETTKRSVVFSDIQIAPIKDQIGHILRNELILRLHANDRARVPHYRLTVELNESTSSLAVRKSALATRANLIMSGAFRLFVVATGADVFTGTSRTTVSYNIFDSEFATLMAEKNARERALRSMSEDIRVRLGVILLRIE